MARIRTVKPEIALHENLYELEREEALPIRFSWCMLFCHCDREGRFEWRPRRLGTQILPYDGIDFARVLRAFAAAGFVYAYRVGSEWYGVIPTFRKHQVINNREQGSDLPSPDEADQFWPGDDISETSADQEDAHACGTREARVDDAQRTRSGRNDQYSKGNGTEGNGTEGNGTEGNGREPPRRPPPRTADRFPEFWAIYPRRRDKAKALEVWKRKGLDKKADEILHDVRERLQHDEQWQREGGRYIPLPTTYLRNERWEDEYGAPPVAGGQRDALGGWDTTTQ